MTDKVLPTIVHSQHFGRKEREREKGRGFPDEDTRTTSNQRVKWKKNWTGSDPASLS